MIDLVLNRLKERQKLHEKEYEMYANLPAARLNASIRIDELKEIEKIIKAVQDVKNADIPEPTQESKEEYFAAWKKHTMQRFEKGV